MQVVIHKNSDGTIGITTPNANADINLVALQCAEANQPYKIVDRAEVEAIYTQYGDLRNAWEWDETITPDGVGSTSNAYGG